MSEVLVPIVVVPTIFFTFYMIIKTISDNVVRKKLVDKGIVDEKVTALFQTKIVNNPEVSLKYGMILIAVGIAVLLGMYAPRSMQEEITISGMFLLGGLALVLYYFFTSKKHSNENEA